MDPQVIVLVILVTILFIAFSWEMYKKYSMRRRWQRCQQKVIVRDEANWCAIYKCIGGCDWYVSIPLKEDNKEVRHP